MANWSLEMEKGGMFLCRLTKEGQCYPTLKISPVMKNKYLVGVFWGGRLDKNNWSEELEDAKILMHETRKKLIENGEW